MGAIAASLLLLLFSVPRLDTTSQMRVVALLVGALVCARSEELATHYFDMLDRDKSRALDLSEIQFFVTNMIQLSGFGAAGDTVNLDDKKTAVDGKTLRQLIQSTFDDVDANQDGLLHLDEATTPKPASPKSSATSWPPTCPTRSSS